jgi:hypothetical protein
VSEDERAIRKRLAALESEVKAEASAKQARKEAALAKLRAERAARAPAAAKPEAPRPAAARPAARAAADDDDGVLEELAASATRRRKGANLDDVGSALALASRAKDVKEELSRPTKKGEKSWKRSAVLSTLLGPFGWLYAGSWREAVPASVAWLGGAYLAQLILPTLLLYPMIFIALPLSGVAGALYALSYNRAGKRQRLFTEEPPPKALGPASPGNDEK